MATAELPRVMIAGLAGDSGKTLVSLGLTKLLKEEGHNVAAFKKGPDFIDGAWLGAASGKAAHNLDTFLMSKETIYRSIGRVSRHSGMAIMEGNRGVFDGVDASGSHSSAELAKMTRTPVLLVVDVTKVTRTVAALVLGCQTLDPELPLKGVILNRVATVRQENVIRAAISSATNLPVVGVIPKLKAEHLPSRHLGLVTAMEHPRVTEALQAVKEAVRDHVDIGVVLTIARGAGSLKYDDPPRLPSPVSEKTVRIGVLRDRAFSFYYPENLSLLEDAGATLLPMSPMEDSEIPAIDALYAGGGFPEVYAEKLADNKEFRECLAKRIDDGLPVWAECGGLMYLSRSLTFNGRKYPMVGAVPVDVEQMGRPQGHGYVRAEVDGKNPFFEDGTELKGHEFHYSRLLDAGDKVTTILKLKRGVGIGGGRDGILEKNLVASYTHLHALGAPKWAPSFVGAGRGGTWI